MDLANIIIAILALIVAVIAIIISACQAKKSDKISLMGLRIDFYNSLCNITNKYKPLTKLKLALSAKNAEAIFVNMPGNNRTISLIISTLCQGKEGVHISIVFKQLIEDLNYLDINKYLFNEIMIAEIEEIIKSINDFKITLSDCLNNKKTETELQDTLEALGNAFDNNIDKLSEQIKKIMLVKYKDLKL